MVKYRWNRPYASARHQDAVLPLLDSLAQEIAASCGEGYVAKPAKKIPGGGGRAAVVTETFDAMRAEAKEHRLAKTPGVKRTRKKK